MARARSNGGGAATAWLVVLLGIGFVVCLVLAIVFYTQVTGLEQERDEARSALDEYVTDEIASAPEVQGLRDEGEGPVVEQLLDQNRKLRSLIGGSAETPIDDLIEQVSAEMDAETVLSELDRLERTLASLEERATEAEELAEGAEERAQQAEANERKSAERYQEQVDELQAQLDEVTSRFEAYQERVTEMESQLREQIDEARRERQDRIVELEAAYDNLVAEHEDLQRRYREATAGGEPLDAPDVIRPDGELVSIQEQSNTAHIDLGREDGLVLGLTFEVFDGDETVRVGERTQASPRGKATVEVINIGDTSSRVRVVRMARDATLERGDQIINLVYDPRTRYRFFVYGDFDIDGSGEPSDADRDRVENLITRWGGRVAEDLSYQVDYLVLGEEPEAPDQLPPGEIDPVRIREHTEATRVYERYQELIAQAEELQIPVLNQNRFLALTGYYER